MPDLINRIEKVLTLEKNKGFADTAVYGGLGKFFATFAANSTAKQEDPHLGDSLQGLSRQFANYAALGISERQAIVTNTLHWLTSSQSTGAAPNRPSFGPSQLQKSEQFSPKTGRVEKPDPSVKKLAVKKEPGARGTTGTMDLNSPVRFIKGVSSPTALRLSKLGIETIHDLLYLFPTVI